jgi:hypothetical protein
MPLRNYEELDEDDFYGQSFQRDGVCSVWLGTTPAGTYEPNVDILQDLCGVGYYSLDNQEVMVLDKESSIAELLADLSYSKSFVDEVTRAAEPKGRGHWIVVQYDFAYDPARVKRKPASDPRFLGVFPYVDDDDDDD